MSDDAIHRPPNPRIGRDPNPIDKLGRAFKNIFSYVKCTLRRREFDD